MKIIRVNILLFVLVISSSVFCQNNPVLDSVYMKTLQNTLYRTTDSMYVKSNSFLSTMKSDIAYELAMELIENKDKFLNVRITDIETIFGSFDSSSEYYLEDLYSEGIYYGASIVFDTYKGLIIDIRFINR